MKKIYFGLIFLILFLFLFNCNSIFAEEFGYGSIGTSFKYINYTNLNSSDYWDNLNTPADILGSDINNDLGWITSAGADSWKGNFTFYYNKSQVDYNMSLISSGTDSWKGNYTFYYNKTQVDNNFSLYTLISNLVSYIGNWSSDKFNYYNKSQVDYNFSLISSSDSWKGNFTFYYNKTQIDNNLSLYYLLTNPYNFVNSTTIGNSTIARSGNYNCSGTNVLQNITSNNSGIYGQCVAQSGSDSWSTNYSNYYNGTIVNSLVISNDTWRTNYSSYLTGANVNTAIAGNLTLTLLKNGTTIATGNFNFGGYNITNIDNITVNKYCNSTKCYVLSDLLATTSSTDSWSLNYTFYYNNTQVNNIISSNDTWRTNYSAYYTGANVNSILGSNLSLTLLVNGSRIITGNMNFGGFNISNIDNLTSNRICNSSTCYVLSDLLATSGSTYNVTYANYVIANISNQTYNWITSNNLTMNGINTTQMRNVNGILTILRNWWDGLYCKLTGCTMTGDLNMNGNNITNVKNISSDYYCNSTNCYTLVQFLTDTTGGTDSWSLNYSFYSNSTVTNSNINNNYTSSLTTCNANINNNLTQINTNLYGNLSNYLLANGSRALTNNWNVGGYNISNVNNVTSTQFDFTGGGKITSNTTCVVITGSSAKLEIC